MNPITNNTNPKVKPKFANINVLIELSNIEKNIKETPDKKTSPLKYPILLSYFIFHHLN